MPNEIELLQRMYDEWRATAPAGLSDDKYFDLFSTEQLLKNRQLSAEDLLQGCIGGAGDGGLDTAFTFLNDELVDRDSPTKTVQREPRLLLFLSQVKTKVSFEEVVFDRVQSTLQNLLDMDVGEDDLLKLYNTNVVDRALVFREKYNELLGRHAIPIVRFVYVTKGDPSELNPKVQEKANNLVELIQKMIPGSSAEVEFVGVSKLLRLARQLPTYTLNLRFHEGSISEENSYVVLAYLRDYYAFITDEAGDLRKYIFEWNVRDYEGNVEVNRDIRATLGSSDSPSFWWLNNGITIIASKATSSSKVMAMDNVQVVNGLQTSMEIHRYLQANTEAGEDQSLLCRIIETSDGRVRDKIIKATNFQTKVSAASLRATDEIQREIEEYFFAYDWYYDRRKNFYKNQGKPADRIVSIGFLAQAVMAAGLGQPNSSRARPTTLIKTDYRRLFDSSIDLGVYLWCAKLMRMIETLLRKSKTSRTDAEKRELRFHVATWLVAKRKRRRVTRLKDVVSLTEADFTNRQIVRASNELLRLLHDYDEYGKIPLDKIVKSREFIDYLFPSG